MLWRSDVAEPHGATQAGQRQRAARGSVHARKDKLLAASGEAQVPTALSEVGGGEAAHSIE